MVNYQNSVVYKLCCKDPSIPDEYIGSTTCRYRRKNSHKSICCNENSKGYNLYVYQFIRENGGFDNWIMIILEEYPCENKRQLEMRERYWIEERKSTLNRRIPLRENQEIIQYREEQIKKYRNENKEEIKEYQDKYREENKEQIREQQKKYKKENKEEIKEYKKKYRKENKEKINEYKKRYYQQKKLKNQSAIIIQKFFKKYLK